MKNNYLIKSLVLLILILITSCFLPGENTISIKIDNKTNEPITVEPTQNGKGYEEIGVDEIVPVLVDKNEEIFVVGDVSGKVESREFTTPNVTWTVSWEHY